MTAVLTRELPGALLAPPALPRPPRRRRRPSSGTWWFLAALAVYATVAVVLVLRHDGVMEDAMARVSAASSVWTSSDPKLAAIGYVWTPLPVLLMVLAAPLRALWPGLVSTGFLAAAVSAGAMASAVSTVWGLLGDRRVRTAPRVVVTVGFALAPMILFYAGNGMTEALLLALLLAAVRRLLRWVDSADTVDLVAAGVLLGLGYLARYEALAAAAGVTVVVATVTALGPARPPRLAPTARRRTAVVVDALVVAGPTALAFVLWAAVSWLVVGSPFEQFTSAYGNAALLSGSGVGAVSPTLPLRQITWLAPALVPLLALALVRALARPHRRRAFALVGVPVAAFGAVLAFEAVTYLSGNLFGFLRYQITAIALVVVLLALLLGRVPQPEARTRGNRALRSTAAAVSAAVLLGAGWVTSGSAMLTEPVGATQEYHRVEPLVAALRGAPVPTDSALGMWASDRQVAARLDALDLPPRSILADSGAAFAVVAASAHPERFLITSDDGFAAALADPPVHGIAVVLRADVGGVDAVRTTWGSFGTPAAPAWVRPLGTVAPATPSSTTWSLWGVTGALAR